MAGLGRACAAAQAQKMQNILYISHIIIITQGKFGGRILMKHYGFIYGNTEVHLDLQAIFALSPGKMRTSAGGGGGTGYAW